MKIILYLFISFVITFVTNVSLADPLDRILARGSLKVCALADRLPFSSRNGNPKGIQIELAEEISKELGVELEITWLRYRFHARKAACDMVMEAVSRKDDDEEKRNIDGARPLTRAGDSNKKNRKTLPPKASIPIVKVETYLVGYDEKIRNKDSVDKLKGMSVGVMNRSWSHMLMQKHGVHYRTKFVTEAELMQGVADKEVDAIFVSSMQYWWYLKNNPDVKLSLLKNFDFEREVSLNVGVLMRGPDQVTVVRINEILSNLLDQGVIENIYASYGIKYVAPN